MTAQPPSLCDEQHSNTDQDTIFCISMICPQNFMSLPFTESLFNIYFKSIIKQISIDGTIIKFYFKQKLDESQLDQFKKNVHALIQISYITPETILKIIPEVPNTFAEILTSKKVDDNHIPKVNFFSIQDDKILPLVFRLDQQALSILLNNPDLRFRIGLTLNNDIIDSNELYDDQVFIQSDTVFQQRDSVLLNQLVLIIDQMQSDFSELTMLSWNTQVYTITNYDKRSNTSDKIELLMQDNQSHSQIGTITFDTCGGNCLVEQFKAVSLFVIAKGCYEASKFCHSCVRDFYNKSRDDPLFKIYFNSETFFVFGVSVIAFMRASNDLKVEILFGLNNLYKLCMRQKFKFCTYCEVLGVPTGQDRFKFMCKNDQCKKNGVMWCSWCAEWHNNEQCTKGDAKKCPRCQQYVKKLDGCNHLICNCKCHFCYLCDNVQSDSKTAIYEHLKSVHNENYDVVVNVHCVFVVDKSGSMSSSTMTCSRHARNNQTDAVGDIFDQGIFKYIEHRIKQFGSQQERDRYTIVMFDNTARVVCRYQQITDPASVFNYCVQHGGGTQFCPALEEAFNVVSQVNENLVPQMIFLTDGGGEEVPSNTVSKMKSLFKENCNFINFGSAAGVEKLAAAFGTVPLQINNVGVIAPAFQYMSSNVQ